MFTSLSEALKGISDIPIALLALVFGILLSRDKSQKNEWTPLFFVIAISAVIGAIVHIFKMSVLALNLTWVVLYVFLFELLRIFSFLIAPSTGEIKNERVIVRIIELALYAAAVFCLFVFPDIDIYALVLYAVLLVMRVIVSFLVNQRPRTSVIVLMMLLIAALLMQALAGVINGSVVAEHIFIAAALCVSYIIAKNKNGETK